MLFLRDGSFQFILTGLFGLTYIVGHFENLITWEFPDEVTLVSSMATIADGNSPGFLSGCDRVAEKAP
ncbi:hypothetical protein N9118_04105 [Akkermansiaceae bacterium]|jgi:hypothetical protein|nr:hypothetical protein [Akkermansiaceae bacterium]|tara:strand:+ start:395 stop:598 length:204 start_codon:yes stop_codon:yes gene_type:complete